MKIESGQFPHPLPPADEKSSLHADKTQNTALKALTLLENCTPSQFHLTTKSLSETHQNILALDLACVKKPRLRLKGDIDILDTLITKKLTEKTPSKPSLSMLPVLKEVEQILPELLKDQSIWKSLYIDYKPPFLFRLFCDLKSETLNGKKIRVCLHYFLPANSSELKKYDPSKLQQDSGENLYHPHGWASCMRIINGIYDQDIGLANAPGINALPTKVCQLTHAAGDSYAMNHPHLWHQVNPRPNQPVSTLMVTHIPENWDQETPRSTKKLRSLNPEELDFMFTHFQSLKGL